MIRLGETAARRPVYGEESVMTETTVSEIQLLSEKINAQVQAHEKYSQAFMEILKTLDQINEQVQKVGVSDAEALRTLTGQVALISCDIRHHRDGSRELKDDLIQKIADYHKSTQGFLHELNLQRLLVTDIAPMMRDLMKKYEVSQDELTALISEALSKLNQIVDSVASLHVSFDTHNIAVISNLNKLSGVPEMLALLVQFRQGWRKVITHCAYYILAAGSIWMLLQGLAQFGIVTFKWFPH